MRTGTTLAHYQVGELLGQGGMGDVYRALDTRLDRPVALKFLARHSVTDPDAKARFIREAKSASALDHPNICTIHDIGETGDGELYLVMAFYEGDTLRHRLAHETFSIERAVSIIRQVAQALKRAHAAGIIHRDIKPANIMVGDDDAVRLLDFGVAKLQSADALTQTGSTLGTAAYMSPEQGLGEPVTPASDVWSLGVMAYEMLAGRLPFQAAQPLALLNKVLSVDPAPITDLRPEVPPALADTLRRALEKDVTKRFADAAEFLDALDGADTGAGGLSAATSRAPRASVGSRRRVMAAAATGIGAILAVAYIMKGPRGEGALEDTHDVVAVLPFTVNGSPDLAYLAEGLMDLVSGRLDGAGPLRTVDTRAVVGLASQEGGRAIDAGRGAEMATSLGAGRFVMGQLVGLPGHVSISARLHDTDASATEQPLVTVEGSADSLFTLVDQLATGLLEASLSGANARIQRNAALSSGSLQATKEFLRGEQFHRRGQFDSASAAYNLAISYDSTFALAHLMKSMNNAYTYDTDDYAAAEKAMRYSDGLPERDRSLIGAFLDQQAGRLGSAEQGYVAHLKRYPDEVKALLQLAVLYNRRNPHRGLPIDQARPLFQRVLALEPDNVPSLHQLARLDAAARRYDSLQARALALERVAPNSEWAVDAATMAAFSLGDTARIQSLMANFADQSLLVRLYAVYNALRFSADPDDADRLIARQRARTLNPATGLPLGITVDEDLSAVLEQMSAMVHGRYDDVRAFLTDPTRSRTATWNVWDAELVVSDVVPVDSATLAQVLERLRGVDPEERRRTLFEPLHDIFTLDVFALERDVNIAKLLGRQGHFEEAWAIQRRLAALPPFRAFESLREDASGAVAADLYYLQGDHQKALEELRTLPFQVPATAASLSITNGSHARFLRAELELELGDPEVARYLFAGLVDSFAPPDKLFLAPAYRRLGQIHEDAGRVDDAIYDYGKLVRAWAHADIPLLTTRDSVRVRLDALRAKADG